MVIGSIVFTIYHLLIVQACHSDVKSLTKTKRLNPNHDK